jgi:UDP-glucuronate decarboxylase
MKCALPLDDPCMRRPDITKAREKLNWTPKTSLDIGLTRTIEWFQHIDLDDYRPPTPNY